MLAHAQEAADRMVRSAVAEGGIASSGLKAFVGLNLFFWHLDAFDRGENPLPGFIGFCEEAAQLFVTGAPQAAPTDAQLAHERGDGGEPESLGALYSAVYTRMDDHEYFDLSREVLRGRLEANGIDPSDFFSGKIVVDAGCGGGKFTQAIAGFGARSVVGVDIGKGNIEFARAQAAKVDHGAKIDYRLGSVLDLPVPDAIADLVWCNSVGHLTGDQGGCLRELARVLKPGGTLFYYVNGRFGLYEIMLTTLQALMTGVPQSFVQHQLNVTGVGAGRTAWIMACFFGPYEFSPRTEIDSLLTDAGFEEPRLLTRGIDIDFSEKIARGEPFADIKYGEGQLKYIARKA